MKALGTGIGAFALTDVEVCRTTGRAAPPATRPSSCCTAAPPRWPAPRAPGRFHLSLTHTDGVAIAFVVAEQAQAASCAPS